jgi:CBS domain-containing protein
MGMPVDKIMVKSVVEINDAESVGAARQRLESYDISALPVVNTDGALVGIVTADDLMIDYDDVLPISRVMTSPVHTLEPNADVSEAARLMREHRHHHVVVIHQGRVVGIVSSLDLLRVIELRSAFG